MYAIATLDSLYIDFPDLPEKHVTTLGTSQFPFASNVYFKFCFRPTHFRHSVRPTHTKQTTKIANKKQSIKSKRLGAFFHAVKREPDKRKEK